MINTGAKLPGLKCIAVVAIYFIYSPAWIKIKTILLSIIPTNCLQNTEGCSKNGWWYKVNMIKSLVK